MALLKKLYRISLYPLRRQIQLLSLLLYFILLQGCSYINIYNNKATVMVSNDFTGEGIAVLSFSKQGSLPREISTITADKVTDALYLKKHYRVIDRTKVNEALAYLQISDIEMLSYDQLQQIGLKLKADYLVLGRVKLTPYKNIASELSVSFRIISVRDTEILGVAECSLESKGDFESEIDIMINDILRKMSIENE